MPSSQVPWLPKHFRISRLTGVGMQGGDRVIFIGMNPLLDFWNPLNGAKTHVPFLEVGFTWKEFGFPQICYLFFSLLFSHIMANIIMKCYFMLSATTERILLYFCEPLWDYIKKARNVRKWHTLSTTCLWNRNKVTLHNEFENGTLSSVSLLCILLV